MKRRDFLKTAAAGTGLLILPKTMLLGANAPSNKLNIALIGTWGRGEAHFDAVPSENVVALCDVNEKHLAAAAKRFPNAKTYVDWRKCLDQKGHRRRGLLHDGPHARLRRQLGAEPRHARLLREAAGQQRRGGPRRPRELAQEKEQAGHAGRHAAPREPELQPRAGADPRRRDRQGLRTRTPGATARSPSRATCPPRASRRRPSTTICGSGRRPSIPTTRSYFAGGPGVNCL